ncbi:LysE/ArgO family amino acid transporter [Williamsia sterculiae]|uniref:L-lysine exporter family protein LysE/ArgO n=1 Tax=Williamsia sterculiae TaxID=1344003 RepID=A0A1N7HCS5_9NOCA|nr:LysE family transporter [Williamsia sterculiae]SIS22676.1 L-lysine exporter family protein LysE/ArgO [Williamsia sterculiae]
MTVLLIALTGLLTGAGLIIAIGPQNVFILRQAVQRRHVAAVVAVCTVSDLVLISAGVAGLGVLVTAHPAVVTVAKMVGGGYILVLAAMAVRRCLRPTSLNLDEVTAVQANVGRWAAVGTALALTWLNPHVYLDTVVTMGAIANSQSHAGGGSHQKYVFAVGAGLASVLWFAGLGAGAMKLAPLFSRPRAWQVLDGIVAVVMAAMGVALIASV